MLKSINSYNNTTLLGQNLLLPTSNRFVELVTEEQELNIASTQLDGLVGGKTLDKEVETVSMDSNAITMLVQ